MFGFNKKPGQVELTVSNRTIIRILVFVITSFLFVAALQKATHALTLLFISFFLALALNAPVHWIALRIPGRKKGSRGVATGLSYMLVMGLLIAFLATIVPPLARQTNSFLRTAPELVESANDDTTTVGSFVSRYNLRSQVDKLKSQVSGRIDDVTETAVATFTRTTSSLFSLLTVLVLTYMMLVEGPQWLKFFKQLVPDEREEHAEQLARDMYRVVKGYVNGQVVLATLAALFIAVPLFILDISYPVALMVIVFICGLIPMVGHTIGAVIVSVVALFSSPWDALIILGYYILYQQIENYVVQPRIQANSTNMSPLLVFASVIVGVSFNGLLGGLVAIPIAGCIRILLLDYLASKNVIPRSQAKQAVVSSDKS
jgi:predicted PurR-regulated permease PerM